MGSDFSDFFRQIPSGMIACLCLSAILLIGSLSAVVISRRRRNQPQAEPAADSNINAYSTPSTYDTGELPDLDVLLDLPMAAAPAPIAPTRPVKPGAYQVKLSDTGELVQAAEVMVIMRDMDEGRLIVQLGDQMYSNLSNYPDGKTRFMKIMKELAGIVAPKAPGEMPTPTAEPTPADAPSGLLSRIGDNKPTDVASMRDLLTDPTPSEPKKPVSSAPPPPLADGSMPGDLPKFKLPDVPLAPRRGSGMIKMSKEQQQEMKKPVAEINIAQAIQAYLQHKLRHTPEYAARSINVSQTPGLGGGVTIEVDGKFYEAVGDIEDTEVRAFLAKTIEEWQSRQ